jgi:hypothetical protein
VNASGSAYLSHTKLNGRFVLRLAIGNMRTEPRHVANAWRLLREMSSSTRASAAVSAKSASDEGPSLMSS